MSLLDNLVSYWRLDEASGTRADAHGSNDLTDNNTVGSTTGLLGNAASFIGANNESLSSAAAGLKPTTGSYSFWFRSNAASPDTFRGVIGREGAIFIFIYGTTSVLRIYGLGSEGVMIDAGTGWQDGQWHHVVLTFDLGVTNGVKLYIDGVSAGTSTWNTDSANGLSIGSRSGFAQAYTGDMDEIGVWSRVLTVDDVAELFNGGAGLDYSSFAGISIPVFFHHLQQQGIA